MLNVHAPQSAAAKFESMQCGFEEFRKYLCRREAAGQQQIDISDVRRWLLCVELDAVETCRLAEVSQ